jgi:hypothetical protein
MLLNKMGRVLSMAITVPGKSRARQPCAALHHPAAERRRPAGKTCKSLL